MFSLSLYLSDGNANTTSLDNLLLSELGEETSLDNSSLLEDTVTKNLEETSLEAVNDGNLAISASLSLLTDTLGKKSDESINVDSGAVVLVLSLVEITHTELTEVTGVILIHHGSVVVLTTGITTTTAVLTVLTCKLVKKML